MLLKDKVALITGAGSGIGRASAVLFAKQGARVVVSDVNEAGGLETVRMIVEAGGDAHFIKCNVGRMDDVRALVDGAVRRYGRIDVLFSNAAAYDRGTATEISEEQWDRTVDVCLKATWMLGHCALPGMVEQGGGVFVITGSVHAIRGLARYTAYQASKGGLLALTRALAVDYAPTVRVNTVLPGPIITGLWDDVPEERRKIVASGVPLKRNGLPDEVAQAALFLASEMSSYMTGTSIVVDGGMTAIVNEP